MKSYEIKAAFTLASIILAIVAFVTLCAIYGKIVVGYACLLVVAGMLITVATVVMIAAYRNLREFYAMREYRRERANEGRSY